MNHLARYFSAHQLLGPFYLHRNRFIAFDADRARAAWIAEQTAMGVAATASVGAAKAGIDGLFMDSAAKALLEVGRVEIKGLFSHGGHHASSADEGQVSYRGGNLLNLHLTHFGCSNCREPAQERSFPR